MSPALSLPEKSLSTAHACVGTCVKMAVVYTTEWLFKYTEIKKSLPYHANHSTVTPHSNMTVECGISYTS